MITSSSGPYRSSAVGWANLGAIRSAAHVLLGGVIAWVMLAPAWSQEVFRHALIVGVSRYADPAIPPLNGVPYDMRSARQIAGALGIGGERVVELRDHQATKRNILAALDSLANEAADGGRALVYFSGHGTRWFDPPAGGCVEGLLTHDGQAIVNREFAERLEAVGARADKLIIMFDACHSGGVTPMRSGTRSFASGLRPKFFVKASQAPDACSRPANMRTRSLLGGGLGVVDRLQDNIVQITSSRPDEVSFDDERAGGLATQGVRDCLLGRARDLDGSGAVTLAEVEHCAQAFVRERVKPFPDLLPHHVSVKGLRNLVAMPVGGAAAPSAAAPTTEFTEGEAAARREKERLAREAEARMEAERDEAIRVAELRAEQIRQEQARLVAEREASERAARLEMERLAREAEAAARQQLERAEQQRLAQALRDAEERERQAREHEQAEQARLAAQLQAEQEQAALEAREQARLERLALEREQRARAELAAAAATGAASPSASTVASAATVTAAGTAPTPIPTPAAPEPPSGPVAALAALRDIHEQRDRRRTVQAVPSASSVKIGKDPLELTITTSHDGYLYVVMMGSDEKSFYLLYPNALDRDNRIRARTAVRLPRPHWQIVAAGPPGRDQLLVVVAEQPRDLVALSSKTPDATMPFAFTGADISGRQTLIDFMLGRGVRQGSPRFGAHWVTIDEVP